MKETPTTAILLINLEHTTQPVVKMPQAQPELKKVSLPDLRLLVVRLTLSQYMEKRLFVQLNGNRKVIGILRGYDVCQDSF